MISETTRQIHGYRHIAGELRRQIQSGTLRPGARLPTFDELHGRYGAAGGTVDKAHGLLQAEGLVVRRRGSGVYVAESRERKDNKSIGIYYPLGDRSHPYWVDLLNGVRGAADEQGVEVTILSETVARTAHRIVQGALITGGDQNNARTLLPLHYPCVFLLKSVLGRNAVVADDYGAGWLAAEYLMNHGHRRIALLSSEAGLQSIQSYRVEGYRDSLLHAGITVPGNWLRILPDHALDRGHVDAGRDGMTQWLANGWSDLGCTALLATNDSIAIGAIQALQSSGVCVPEDVSVMGFDGTEYCKHIYPVLTSVKIPLYEIGRASVDLLLGLLAEPGGAPQVVTLPVEIAPGGTVAKA